MLEIIGVHCRLCQGNIECTMNSFCTMKLWSGNQIALVIIRDCGVPAHIVLIGLAVEHMQVVWNEIAAA